MFLSRIRASAADDRSAYGDFWFTPVNARTASGVSVSPERALQLPVVLACVRVLAESHAILPLKIYSRTGAARKLIEKHWLYDLFRRPNPYQTSFEWREMVQGHLALRGNAYNRMITDRRGNITALLPLHPDRVRIEMLDEYDYRYKYAKRDGTSETLTRAEVWQLRGLSSDGVVGLSPIALARESAALGLAAQEYGARFFQNDAKPGGGWIEFPGNFKDKSQREQFRESFQEAQSGLNRGKIAVLEYGMKFHELGLTNKDSQFLEARSFQVTDIARIFRVPPHLVGDLTRATFSNIEQQSLDFVIHCMTPWAERWESAIETDLLLEDDDSIEVEFDFSRLLRGDQAARGTFYHNGIMDGWLTRNEARSAEGREPIDGLDEPLRPLNMVEESQAQNDPNAAASNPPVDDETSNNDDEPDARLAALLNGNARRMARRIASGSMPSADVLADALAIEAPAAAAWLAIAAGTEDELTDALLELAQ